jgi:hypothetical protein
MTLDHVVGLIVTLGLLCLTYALLKPESSSRGRRGTGGYGQ